MRGLAIVKYPFLLFVSPAGGGSTAPTDKMLFCYLLNIMFILPKIGVYVEMPDYP